jgi:hypothetical protein
MKMTDEQRAKVHPLLGDPVTLPANTDAGWRVLQVWRDQTSKYFERGVPHSDEPHRSHLKAALDLTAHPTGASDPKVEASLMTMLDYWSRRGLVLKGLQGELGNARYRPVDEWFVDRWLKAGGVPFALSVLAAFPSIAIDNSRGGRADTHTLGLKDGEGKWWALEVGHLSILHTLRRFVIASDDYAVGVRAAETMRESSTDWMRGALSFVFPDEAAFYESDALRAIPKGAKARTPPWSWGLVTTRLSDETRLLEILESVAKDSDPWVTDTQDYGYSLVARLGDDAAPFLVHVLGLTRAKTTKAAFADALALTQHRTARDFFEKNAKAAAYKTLAKHYLSR